MYFDLGTALLQKGRVDEAITALTAAIDLDKEDAQGITTSAWLT